MTFDRLFRITGRGYIAVCSFDPDEEIPKIGSKIVLEGSWYEVTGVESKMTLPARLFVDKTSIGLLVRRIEETKD